MSDYETALDALAYTVGFFMGDGCLTSYPFVSPRNGKTYHKNDVVFGKPDREVIERVRDQIAAVFGKSYSVTTRTLRSGLPYYGVTAHRREIFDFFATNTLMRAALPAHYFGAGRETQLEVLRGLFDSDGHVAEFVDAGKLRWSIGFSNTNRPLVESVASMLQRLGVKVGVITEMHKGGYRTCFGVRPNARSFIDAGMFFYSRRRQERLESYLAQMCASETASAAPVTSGEDTVQHLAKAS